MLKILHVNSYFITNKLHCELVQKFDTLEWSQLVFIPVGNKKDINKNQVEGLKRSELRYNIAFSQFSRFIWPIKMLGIWFSFKRLILEIGKPEIVHAHSLIVNGLIAFIFNKATGTPYVVTVRNTDINIFLSKSFIFRWMGNMILKNANRIIFLSPAYRNFQLKSNISEHLYKSIFAKTIIIPNGINDFWFKNKVKLPKQIDSGVIKIIFSGKLRDNKNVSGLINACEILQAKGVDISLDIVGDGPLFDKLKQKKTNLRIKLHGFVSDKVILANIYRSCHIMVVPSFRESFGLIYVEGMSQGLPAIYSQGQGFDGFFDDGKIGYAVNPKDILDIAAKIKLTIDNYDTLSRNSLMAVKQFSWDNTVNKLSIVYDEVINEYK